MFQIQTGAVRGEVFQNLVSIGKDDTGVDAFGVDDTHIFVCVCSMHHPRRNMKHKKTISFPGS